MRFTAYIVAALLLLATDLTATRAFDRGAYEQARLQRVLDKHGWSISNDAAGRTIHQIHIMRRDVLAEDEWVPTFPNALHWLTEAHVVRRELLFAEGEVWDPVAVEESMRNLRSMTIFSLVAIVPIDNGSVDSVDVVVFTRDLWSLRLESSLQVTGGLLDDLSLTLIERNLLGRNKKAALGFALRPKSWSLNQRYNDRRVLGSRVALNQTFGLVFGRDAGTLEGSNASLSVSQPFYNLRSDWGWTVEMSYDVRVGRQLSGREILTYDVPETDEVETIPRVWDRQALSGSARGRYQFGGWLKQRLALGFAGSDASRDPNTETDLEPGQAEAFRRDVLGINRRQFFPFLIWTGFANTFRTFADLAAYGVSEDVQVGPWWSALVAAPLEAFGSSRDAIVWELSAGARFAPGDALIDFEAGIAGRLELGELIDQRFAARLRGATPRFDLGRVVVRAHWEGRIGDTNRTLVTLGGDNGLRGYSSQAFFGFGANRLRTNIELRTPAVVWSSLHFGGVVFHDSGAVYGAVSDFELRQSVGIGLRVFFPQFNRFVFRVDLGAPLGDEGFTVLLTFGTLQAVALTTTEDLAQ